MTPADGGAAGVRGCPFCGATPHRGLDKIQHCHLHGEPFQTFTFSCPNGCAKITRPDESRARDAWNTRVVA